MNVQAPWGREVIFLDFAFLRGVRIRKVKQCFMAGGAEKVIILIKPFRPLLNDLRGRSVLPFFPALPYRNSDECVLSCFEPATRQDFASRRRNTGQLSGPGEVLFMRTVLKKCSHHDNGASGMQEVKTIFESIKLSMCRLAFAKTLAPCSSLYRCPSQK